MTVKQPNRIAAEDLEGYQRWSIPEMEGRGNIIPSAEKEKRAQLAAQQKQSRERIEDVDSAEVDLQPITAEKLQEITEAAEKDGYEHGRQQGYNDGYEEGRRQGAEDMREQLRQQQQRLEAVADALLTPLAPQDDAIEHALLDMVATLTRSLVKRELLADSGHILTLVQEAIAALPIGAKNLTVHLNPDDLALVEAFAEERQKDWRFIGDPQLLPGGCRVETRESLVDFSVEQRLQSLLTQFESKQLGGGEDSFEEPLARGNEEPLAGEIEEPLTGEIEEPLTVGIEKPSEELGGDPESPND